MHVCVYDMDTASYEAVTGRFKWTSVDVNVSVSNDIQYKQWICLTNNVLITSDNLC